MLKNLHENSLSYLLFLFNKIFSSNTYPLSWKTVIIHPFLKLNSDPTLPASYRLIALSSVLGKLHISKNSEQKKDSFGSSNQIIYSHLSNTVSEKAVAPLNLFSISKTKLINPHSQNPVLIPSSSTSKKPTPGSGDIKSATNFSMPVYEATYLQYFKVFSTIEP